MKNLIPIAIGSRSGCFARRISLSIVSNGKELRLDHDWNLGRSPKSTKRQVRTFVHGRLLCPDQKLVEIRLEALSSKIFEITLMTIVFMNLSYDTN